MCRVYDFDGQLSIEMNGEFVDVDRITFKNVEDVEYGAEIIYEYSGDYKYGTFVFYNFINEEVRIKTAQGSILPFYLDREEVYLVKKPYEAPRKIVCECGAKHTSRPDFHSEWCPLKFKK